MAAVSALILLCAVVQAYALVGYDCSGQSLNLTTMSLLSVGECTVPNNEPVKEPRYIQLMQLMDFDQTPVIQCRIEMDRSVFYCGMHSHISLVHNGRREYIVQVSRDTCKQLHATGMMAIGSSQIAQIRRNATETRALVLAGTIGTDGSCKGTQYSDAFGTWDNVVVQASIKVTLRDYIAPVQIKSDEIILQSGTRCPTSEGYCTDSDGSDIFWSPIPHENCNFGHYDVLYEGLATRLSPREGDPGLTVYTVTTHETTFALTRTSELPLCGYTLLKTEHPKLFLMETSKGSSFRSKTQISVNNLDIFAYVNSKFIYVEKHMKTQMTQLYRDIILQKCALEQQVLKNALALAETAPDEMAFSIMKGPGYMAIPASEVVHIAKCVPVDCKLRRVDACYRELPVTYGNASVFVTPKSRIITKYGTLRDCNPLAPIMYQIRDQWYRMTPEPAPAPPPPTVEPLSEHTWTFTSPQSLATSGIYTNKDLTRLRNHLMFPVETPAILQTLARGAAGRTVPTGSISMLGLLDEGTINKIAESAGARMWKGFITFGSASAGVLAIFIIARGCKLLIDTLIHGYALHSVYGWSIHLLGAIWSSVTHLLLHLARPNEPAPVSSNESTEALPPTPESQATAPPPHFPSTPVPEARKPSFTDLRRYLQTPPSLDSRPALQTFPRGEV